ncbi:MAG: putative peptide zinc metalloprotease protein [Actinomycetota bacterium]|nr:putative peptide zinc metalloprotease protein [Actinomycetota bacterium]
MFLRRTLVVLTTVITFVLGAAHPALADSDTNNYVQSDNSSPAQQMAKSRVMVATSGKDVTAENVAYSRSHDCTGCRTLAVAVEAVLVPGTPTTFTPKNVAVALNERCSSCATFAAAHQYVVQTGGPRKLSDSAEAKVERIGAQIRAVTNSGADFPTIDQQIDDLANQLWAVVNQDITAHGGHPSGTPTKG